MDILKKKQKNRFSIRFKSNKNIATLVINWGDIAKIDTLEDYFK
jgi:hypothetical protein